MGASKQIEYRYNYAETRCWKELKNFKNVPKNERSFKKLSSLMETVERELKIMERLRTSDTPKADKKILGLDDKALKRLEKRIRDDLNREGVELLERGRRLTEHDESSPGARALARRRLAHPYKDSPVLVR